MLSSGGIALLNLLLRLPCKPCLDRILGERLLISCGYSEATEQTNGGTSFTNSSFRGWNWVPSPWRDFAVRPKVRKEIFGMDKERERFTKAMTEVVSRIHEARTHLERLPFTSVAILDQQMRRLQEEIQILKGALYERTAAANRADKSKSGMGDVPRSDS